LLNTERAEHFIYITTGTLKGPLRNGKLDQTGREDRTDHNPMRVRICLLNPELELVPNLNLKVLLLPRKPLDLRLLQPASKLQGPLENQPGTEILQIPPPIQTLMIQNLIFD
jgi:hypothetical protein